MLSSRSQEYFWGHLEHIMVIISAFVYVQSLFVAEHVVLTFVFQSIAAYGTALLMKKAHEINPHEKIPQRGLAESLMFDERPRLEKIRMAIGIYIPFGIFPLRIFALGNSRLAFIFAFTTAYCNCIANHKSATRFIAFNVYISICYSFSPVFCWEDLWVLYFFQAIYSSSSIHLRERNERIKKLYQNQSLHMSSIYHEIKTPMNGIVCANELIAAEVKKIEVREEMYQETEKIREWLEVSRASSISLSEMIENMLSFSKLQTSNVTLDLTPLNLTSLFSPLQQILGAYPRSANVNLEIVNQVPLSIGVMAHPTALRQVLINTTTNALKFTSKGEVNLFARYLDATNEIQFEVSDTGIGMSQEFIDEKLFVPFEQEERPLTGAQRGVGLGMTLSQQMIQKMKGEIKVRSEKESGTQILITLPAVNLPTLPRKRNSISFPMMESSSVVALVVDDNPTNRKVMEHLLRLVGFESHVANSGEEALSKVKNWEGDLDVIVMDIFMPGMGGIEASRQIRKVCEQWENPPEIVGCTADTSEKTLKECQEGGITSFLHKPVNKKELEKILMRLKQQKL